MGEQISTDGTTVTDRAQIAAELERTLNLGLPMEAKARHMFVADNVAQMVLDWSISGTAPDGKHIRLSCMASDVLRRGPDGRWQVLIDNNQGTVVRRPTRRLSPTPAHCHGAISQVALSPEAFDDPRQPVAGLFELSSRRCRDAQQ